MATPVLELALDENLATHDHTESDLGAILDSRYLNTTSNLSDLENVATARTNLGLVAGGTGDIWVEKAGDTMTGALVITPTANGTSILNVTNQAGTSVLNADTTNQRVGIGTTSPGFKLEVNGIVASGVGGVANTIAQLRADGTGNETASNLILNDLDANKQWQLVNKANSSNALQVINYNGTSFTTPMVIQFGGNVGIGTTSPISTLQVTSTTGATISYGGKATVVSGDVVGSLDTYSNDASINMTGVVSRIRTIAEADFVSSQAKTSLAFHTNTGVAGSLAEWMRITSAGNVGIGTTSPGAKLHVENGTGNATAVADMIVSHGLSNSGTYLQLGTNGNAGYPNYVGATFGSGGGSGGPTAWAGVGLVMRDNANQFTAYGGGVRFQTAPQSTVKNISYTSIGTRQFLFSADSDIWGTPPGSKFTVGSNTYTVKAAASDRITVIEDNSGEAATGTLTGVSYAPTRLTITTSGNVGIGTTSPASLLNINSTLPRFYISDSDATANNKHWFFENNGGVLGFGTTTDALGVTNTRALTISNAGILTFGKSKIDYNYIMDSIDLTVGTSTSSGGRFRIFLGSTGSDANSKFQILNPSGATELFAVDYLGDFAVGGTATSTMAGNLDVAGSVEAAYLYTGDLVFSNGFRFKETDNTIYIENAQGKKIWEIDNNGKLILEKVEVNTENIKNEIMQEMFDWSLWEKIKWLFGIK